MKITSCTVANKLSEYGKKVLCSNYLFLKEPNEKNKVWTPKKCFVYWVRKPIKALK